MNTFLIIALSLLVLFWITSKLRKGMAAGMAASDSFLTQVKFVQMYMKNNTEHEFLDMDEQEAIEHGQNMLWSAADDFNARMVSAIVHKEPVKHDDYGLINSAIRIVKAAEAMVHIKKHGPLRRPEQDDSDGKKEAENRVH